MNVFILGAGFSKAVSPQMPDMRQLSEGVLDYLGRYDPQLRKRVVKFEDNFEHLLTYLGTPFPWLSEESRLRNRADFIAVTRVISEALKASQMNAMEQVEKFSINDPVLRWVKKLSDDYSAVISFNYDLIFEKLLGKINIRYADVYPIEIPSILTRGGAGIFGGGPVDQKMNLIKLHGSLNWVYSGSASYYGEQIFDIGLEFYKTGEESPASREMVRLSFDKVPLIIPPTFSKSDYFKNEQVEALWRWAAKFLRAADTITFVGYSMPKADFMLRYLLRTTDFTKLKEVIVADPISKSIISEIRDDVLRKEYSKSCKYIQFSSFDQLIK